MSAALANLNTIRRQLIKAEASILAAADCTTCERSTCATAAPAPVLIRTHRIIRPMPAA